MSDPSPRGPTPSAVSVLSVMPRIPVTVRFLGGILGLLTHWSGRRSIPCPGEAHCPPALHRGRAVWKGYAAVEEWRPLASVWIPAVLEVTEALEEQLHGRELRGETWLLDRADTGKKPGRVSGVLCGQSATEELRAAFPIDQVLRRFYHTDALQLGVVNPLPPRLFLTPSKDPAPLLPAALAVEPAGELPASPEDFAKLRARLQKVGLLPIKNDGSAPAERSSKEVSNGRG